MKVDKRIVGLATVSVILSTLIMFTIAGERIDEPVEILKNDYPPSWRRIERRPSLSLW